MQPVNPKGENKPLIYMGAAAAARPLRGQPTPPKVSPTTSATIASSQSLRRARLIMARPCPTAQACVAAASTLSTPGSPPPTTACTRSKVHSQPAPTPDARCAGHEGDSAEV